MIELAGVHKAFNHGRHNELWALRDITLTLPPRQVTVFHGPSGSGKTTLLALVGCLGRPTMGRVRLDGSDISGLPERFVTAIRRRTFGVIFQQFHLVRGLSALDNVMLPAYPLAGDWPTLARRAAALLGELELGARASTHVEWLSGGEQQRVAIARALINDPAIILADEPTANLDSALARDFLGILARLAREGRSILMTSHDPLVVQSALVQRVVTLRDGRIVGDA